MKSDPQQFLRFMYEYMDLDTMEEKTLNKKYKYVEQFKADAQTLYHNVFICYGGELKNFELLSLLKTILYI